MAGSPWSCGRTTASGDDHLGNFYVYAAYQNDGQEHESYSFGNGEYILRYSVH